MRAGAALMQIEAGIPAELVDVLQATILLFLVASPFLRSCSGSAARRPASAGRDDHPSYGGGWGPLMDPLIQALYSCR